VARAQFNKAQTLLLSVQQFKQDWKCSSAFQKVTVKAISAKSEKIDEILDNKMKQSLVMQGGPTDVSEGILHNLKIFSKTLPFMAEVTGSYHSKADADQGSASCLLDVAKKAREQGLDLPDVVFDQILLRAAKELLRKDPPEIVDLVTLVDTESSSTVQVNIVSLPYGENKDAHVLKLQTKTIIEIWRMIMEKTKETPIPDPIMASFVEMILGKKVVKSKPLEGQFGSIQILNNFAEYEQDTPEHPYKVLEQARERARDFSQPVFQHYTQLLGGLSVLEQVSSIAAKRGCDKEAETWVKELNDMIATAPQALH